MENRRKFWLIAAVVVLAFAGIACGFNTFKPTPTLPPTSIPPTLAPLPTLEPTLQPAQGDYTNMIGSWMDPDTNGTVTTIMGLGGGLTIDSVVNPERGGNEYISSDWSNGVLTWIYCVPHDYCYTTETVSVSGDSLKTDWWDDAGNSGATTFQRVDSAPSIKTGPVDGLANRWLDPDTGTFHLVIWENDEYVVAASMNPDRGGNEVTESSWANGVLTWTYCVPGGSCVTTKTVSVSPCSLDTTWSNNNGYSGSTTLECMP